MQSELNELQWPFDPGLILKKKKSLRRKLLERADICFLEKRIAILGGQTTEDIKLILELFLLNYGIKPSFYESEFNQYFEDGMFPNERLENFSPDIIYVCTCVRNITEFPGFGDSKEEAAALLERTLTRFTSLWDRLREVYRCPVIQNNFEYPYYRLMGNRDAADHRGRVNFVSRLNQGLYDYAESHEGFHVCDVNYISASYGLERWSDPHYWHMYKYGVAVPAIPFLSFNVANIVKAIFGKNKKALNLDLDNTLWGGVVGDDGAENIAIGQETPLAQSFSEFQAYLKSLSQMGVVLTVNSKNMEENALAGLSRPDSLLSPSDFAVIKANWEPKSRNLLDTAASLNLLPESFVFVDDNPAEREIIRTQVEGVACVPLTSPEHYVADVDRGGYFEVVGLSEDDIKRGQMYRENAKRAQAESSFSDYGEYLRSLEMKAEIAAFSPMYMSRIAQLTNKSNQFNLTTRRYTKEQIEEAAGDLTRLTLYGKLSDKFGDNGVVSVLIGRQEGGELHMELWLMSCRVLKRQMEFAMMDELVGRAKARGVARIVGYYYPTAKNGMVRDFYGLMGFEKKSEAEDGSSVWVFDISDGYKNKQDVIKVGGPA